MSRVLRFPDEPVGAVFLITEGVAPEEAPAQGEVVVPEGGKVFLFLDASAPGELPFLAGVADDVVLGAQLQVLDRVGLVRLLQQRAVTQLGIAAPLDDECVGLLAGLPELKQLEVALSGPGGPGVGAVTARVSALSLHGDPGTALAEVARSTTLTRLQLHLDALDTASLQALAAATHLDDLAIEVGQVFDGADPAAVEALAAVASGLSTLTVVTPDGESAVAPAVLTAVLSGSDGLTLNGTTYTTAALARLRRRAELV